MSELHEDVEKTKLQRYLANKSRTDFVKEVDNMSVDQLNAKMLGLAKYREEITNTMKADDKLKKLADEAREARRPYNEDKLMNKKLARYVALVLEERGELGCNETLKKSIKDGLKVTLGSSLLPGETLTIGE